MLRIEISNWQLIKMVKENVGMYNRLRDFTIRNPHVFREALKEVKYKEDGSVDIGYMSFEMYLNSPADLEIEFYPWCEWKPVPTLTMVGDRGIMHKPLEAALQANQVHLPGDRLLQITQVKVLVDSCTEDLGAHLEEGWRIVACLPQHLQRRPDYVLGKVNNDKL